MDIADRQDWGDFEELHDLDLDLGDEGPPPPPIDEEPRRGGGEPWRARREDELLFHPLVTLGVCVLMTLLTMVTVAVIYWGARGGPLMAWAAIFTFIVLFIGPLIAGALWFGQHR